MRHLHDFLDSGIAIPGSFAYRYRIKHEILHSLAGETPTVRFPKFEVETTQKESHKNGKENQKHEKTRPFFV
jgi:hypothetical protein